MLSPPHRITSLQTQPSVTNPFSIERGSNDQYASSTFSINSSIVEGKCFFEFAPSNAAKNDRSKWFKSGDRAGCVTSSISHIPVKSEKGLVQQQQQ